MNKVAGIFLALGVFLLWASPTLAGEKTVVPFDAALAEKGFTATTPDDQFTIEIDGGVLESKGTLSLRTVRDLELPSVPFGRNVSDVFHYNFNTSGKGFFKKTVTLTVALSATAGSTTRLYVFDKKENMWRSLPTTVDRKRHTASAKTHYPFSIVSAFEEQAYRTRLTKIDIQEDSRVASPDQTIALLVKEGSLKQQTEIVLKRLDELAKQFPIPENTRMVSSAAYEYSFKGKNVKLHNPIDVTLSYDASSETTVAMYILDKKNSVWKELPSRVDREKQTVTVELKGTYAPLVVLEKQNVYEGIASWYQGNDATDAATNLFPLGTKLKVTNLETGASVDVVVVSTWAGVKGRVVDLTRSAFQQIAKLGAGVARVRIEEI